MASPLNSSWNPDRISSCTRVRQNLGEMDLLGEFRYIYCPSSESQGKGDVGWAENTFGFRSVWEYLGQVDNPRSRGILFGGRDG